MKRAITLALVVVFSMLLGCSDDPALLPPGTISIGWIIGTSGCTSSGIETVVIYIEGADQTQTTVRSFDCDAGEATLSNLQPGTYDLILRGRDSEGRDRFGEVVPDVEVRSEGNTNVGTIRLSALPASIIVTWYFENGRMCAYNEITEVIITLFDDQDYEKGTATTACETGQAEMEEVEADSYLVNVDALDEDGNILFNGQEDVVLDRGDQLEVEVRLSAVGGR